MTSSLRRVCDDAARVICGARAPFHCDELSGEDMLR